MSKQITNAFQELDACFDRTIEEFEAVTLLVEALHPITMVELEAARERPYSREQLDAERVARDNESAVLHLSAQLRSFVRTLLHDRSRLADIDLYRTGEWRSS
ncbi:hypothetical protein [Shinella sp.]|uniref:hypothetical protein n=1 Tax=Shinella sp. TaxID=1870904 RepID=UPI003F70CA88